MTAPLDRDVLRYLGDGDHAAAATAAVSALGPQILGYLCTTLRDDDAAHDVFGDFCEELWTSIKTFRGEGAFKTWAYTLVMRSVGRYQRDGYRRRAESLSEEVSALVAQARSTTAPYRKSEVKDRFAKLRESLEPDEQTLLFLRIDQGLAWNDIAEIMSARGEPVEAAALRKRFERAKARLRQLAADAGLIES